MTIEATLERIAAALETIAAGKTAPVQTSIPLTAAPAVVPVPVAATTPVVAPVAPNVPLVPIPAASAPAAPAPVVAAPVPTDCPIKDGKSLMDYVVGVYKQIGPTKGAQIQNVLNGLGCAAINEVRPDQYGAFYAQIEALKAA